MANISFDTLYQLYKKEKNFMVRENMLKSYVFSCAENEGVLLEAKNFLEDKKNNIAGLYRSEQIADSEKEKINGYTCVMQQLAYALDNYLGDLKYEAIERLKKEDPETEKYIDDFYDDERLIFEAQNLFKHSPEQIKKAYQKYYYEIDEVTPEVAADVISFIERVQKDGALIKVFGCNDYTNVSIEQVLTSLFDYYKKDESKFKLSDLNATNSFFDESLRYYFLSIKAGNETGEIDFKKYRPSVIGNRAFAPEMEKLVFARNIINFKRTGIMPSSDGFIDFFVDEEEAENLSDKLAHVFSRHFDMATFRENQSSPIFNIDSNLIKPIQLEETKAGLKDNTLAIGMLLTSDSSSVCEYVRQFYLLHIIISDVANDKCKYEIGLSIIPEAQFDSRIQLMRLDNYATKASHRNLANKLDTTTHVHLYNHFDLIRGKTNGEYEIVYNFDEDSSDFSVALRTFMVMMGADEKLSKSIIAKTQKLKKSAERHLEM